MRVIIAQLWAGPIVVRRLAAADPAPTLAELDQSATAMIARNDGIRPTVRVLERSGIGGGLGVAGSVPR